MVVTLCDGESYQQAGNTYSESGIYEDVLASQSGCDSVVIAELTVLPVSSFDYSATTCSNEPFETTVGIYGSSGTYEEILVAANGCDSIVQFQLTVLPTQEFQQERFICNGEEFQVGSSIYTEEGEYVDVLQSVNGCDSTVTTILGVLDEIDIPDSTLCDGDTLELDMSPFPVYSVEGFSSVSNSVYAFETSSSGYVLIDLDGCILEDSFTLEFLEVFSTEFTDIVLCDEEIVTLEGRGFDIPYRWLSGEDTPSLQVDEPGIYVKEYEYYCGDFQDRFNVEERACNCFVYVPNAFTPDGDGVNDKFGVEYKCEFIAFEFIIYDRYGNPIFSSTDPSERWDGGAGGYYVSPGLYHFSLRYSASDRDGPIEEFQIGTITVLR
jgi:gliding motility-associated-like protein